MALIDLDAPVGGTSGNWVDLDAPVAPRSLFKEVPVQVYAGATIDFPKMVGQAIKWMSEPGGNLYDIGADWARSAEAREAASPELQPQVEGRSLPGRALTLGARALAPSLATMVPAAIAAPLGGVAMAGAAAAGSFGIFGSSQAQETRENVLKAGGSGADADRAGWINFLIEGGGETLGTIAGYKLLGIGAKALGKSPVDAAIKGVTETAILKPFLTQLPKTAAVEAGTEFGQNFGEAAVEQAFGVPDKEPWTEGAQGGLAALGMTALLAPFGITGFAIRAKSNERVARALTDPEAPDEVRTAAAAIVNDAIMEESPEAAKAWQQNATIAIAGKLPITLDETAARPRPLDYDLDKLMAAGSVDEAISAAVQATEPVYESDVGTSVAGRGLISGAMDFRPAEASAAREAGYADMERQRQENIAATARRAQAARDFEARREAEMTAEARATRNAEIGDLIREVAVKPLAERVAATQPTGAVGLALRRAFGLPEEIQDENASPTQPGITTSRTGAPGATGVAGAGPATAGGEANLASAGSTARAPSPATAGPDLGSNAGAVAPAEVTVFGRPVEELTEPELRVAAQSHRMSAFREAAKAEIERRAAVAPPTVQSEATAAPAVVSAASTRPQAPASAAEQTPNLPAHAKRLYVERGNERFEVASLEDASRKWGAFRDTAIRQGGSTDDVGGGARIVDQDGAEVARISYNGKVWPPGEWKPGVKPLVGEPFKSSLPPAREPTTIDQAAHEAAISPQNALPEPTEAQKEAGNYQKGHVRVAGLEISIENPAGSKRRPEWPALHDHYGYVVGVPAKASDKDHVDVFVKPGMTEDFAGDVYVVGQYKKNGTFDEPKTLIGPSSVEEAAAMYRRNYEKGWTGGKKITSMPMATFEQRLQDPQAFTHEQPEAIDMPAAGQQEQMPAAQVAPEVKINGQLPSEMTVTQLQMAAKSAPFPDQRRVAGEELKRRDRRGETVLGRAVDQLTDKELEIVARKGRTATLRAAAVAEGQRRAEADKALQERLKATGMPELLSAFAADAGWAQRGGHLIRIKRSEVAGDETISRTTWIPRAEWWRSRPVQEGEQFYKDAVKAAIDGGKLTRKQKDVVQFLLGLAEDERAGSEVPPQTTQADAAAAEALVELAGPAPSDWSKLSEEQKDAELDALFGADSRPQAAVTGEETRAQALAGEVGPRGGEPAAEVALAAAKEPWQMTRDKFAAAVERGKLHKATGRAVAGESKAKTPLRIGELNGYSSDDIAHFYAVRRGYPGSASADYDPIAAGRDQLIRDARAEGKSFATKRPAFDLAAQTEAELKAKADAEAATARESEAISRKADEDARREREQREVARRSQAVAGEFSLSAPEAVDRKTQQQIDAKRAEDELAGQGDILGPVPAPVTAERAKESDDDYIRRVMKLERAAFESYDQEQAVSKRGRGWSYTTTSGTQHPGIYDTKREAVEAARRHKQLKLEQYDDPTSFWDVVSVVAGEHLKLIEKYMAEGMTEMDAGQRAREEIPDRTPQRAAPEPAPANPMVAAADALIQAANAMKAAVAPKVARTKAEVEADITALTEQAAARRDAAKDESIKGLRPTATDWMTPEEFERYQDLQAELTPLTKADRALAADRVAEKRAARVAAGEEERIEDVGENLWYNRRNFTGKALAWTDVKDLNDTLKVKEVVKSKVWPRPDYEQLVADGMQPFFARMLKQIYDGIAVEPSGKTDADLERYIAVVGRVREAVFDWAKDNNANREFLSAIAERAKPFGQQGPISLAGMAKPDNFVRVIVDRVWPETVGKTVGRFRGGEPLADVRIIGGNRALQAMQLTLNDAVAAMKDLGKGWPAKQEAWQRQGYQIAPSTQAVVSEGARYDKDGKQTILWSVATADGWKGRTISESYEKKVDAEAAKSTLKPFMLLDKRGRLISQHDTEPQAQEAAREATKREGGGRDLRGMNIEESERTGPERRAADEDVSSDRLMSEFGFRGINFGREGWINQAERQAYLNHAYDALFDLAEILGVPPKALSLNGMLGIAFGAQGRGGQNAAHFVPGHNEINLTKTKGAGTLAHEWGHALDHYFATQADMAKRADPFLSEYPKQGGEIRPEIVAAMKAVTEAMNRRPMTPDEHTTQQSMARASTMKSLEGWLRPFRNMLGGKEAALAEFEQLADRMRRGDLGEGYVQSGNKQFRPVIAQVRNLVKDATGRLAGLQEIEALASWAHSVQFNLNRKEADAEHVPQTTSTTYYRESAKADRDKGGKRYWNTEAEKFARAFETYVADQLAERAQQNTFLSDAALRAEMKDREGKGFAMPYPRADERKATNAAIGKLVAEIKTRETDRGVAMFSQPDTSGVEAGERAGAFANDPSETEAAKVQAGVEGKTAREAALFVARTAPDRDQRMIAFRVAAQIRKMEAAGLGFTMNVAHLGEDANGLLAGKMRGVTWRSFDSKTTDIWVQGADVTGLVGVSYETVLHELLHAVTQSAINVGERPGNTAIHQDVADLLRVHAAIAKHFNQRIDAVGRDVSKLDSYIEKIVAQGHNSLRDPGEMVAWALTNRAMQDYLESIPYQGGTLWTRFVTAIRKFLGLLERADTALAEILRITDRLLDSPVQQLLSVSQPMQRNYNSGLLNFSRAAWIGQQPADTQEALRKAGVWFVPPTLKDRVKVWSADWQKRLKQGVFDQFDPIKEYDYHAYMLARMTRGADAALDGLLHYGTVYLDQDGAVDVNFENGGFLGIMSKLAGEHDRFLAWVIGNRAERLLAEGREHNFTPQDIARLKALNQGQMPDGSSRATEYARVRAELDRYNKSVLDIAEKAGLIDGASRVAWEKDFYVPFYRLMEDADQVKGPMPSKGLVNQYAFKVLKGGEQAIGDPMENILKNWSHLLDASLKNQAARESLLAAQRMGVVVEGTEDTVRQMAKAARLKDAVVSFTDQGEQRWFMVEDAFLLDAIKAVGFSGFQGTGVKVMQKFKKWLTMGVTVSPTFRIRNVIRDSLQMIGTNPASYNVLDNVLTGWKATKEGSPEFASILAGGGVMRFGTLLEGDRAEHVKRLIESGIDDKTILTTPEKIKDALQQGWDWWQHVGDRAENVNRAALYKTLRAQGKTHLEASFAARDTMDFSMQGTWAAIRFLSQTVPFWNARLQGLYKLGRGAAEDPRRFGIVVGGAAIASIALLLAYKDDDDWKQREDWDRETYWWFKIGDKAFRIPKPFEIGAIATLAERGLEAMISDDLTGKQLASRVYHIAAQQLSMNPVPQLAMPLIELYANRDSFTDRPIESMGMERLSKAQRAGPGTSATARLLGKNGIVSPVQIDHLVSGYFGWLGAHVIATADLALRPTMGLPPKPAWRVDEVFVLGDFVKDMPAYQSKYVTRLYDQMKEVQQAMADLKELQKVGATEEAKKLLEDKGDKIRLYHLYTNAQKQMTNVNRQIKMVPYRDGTVAEKRERLDALYKIKNRIAETTELTARSTRQ